MSSQIEMPLPTQALLVSHGAKCLNQTFQSYYAIEDLLYVHEKDADSDSEKPMAIDRGHLRQLLIVLNTKLQEEIEFLERTSEQLWRKLVAENVPGDHP